MVFNYKRLNDNCHEDGYKILDKDQLLNKIQNSKWYSKFNMKSGFWQVKMHPNSINWTIFSCLERHFEWLVIPFGLEVVPQIFQRKMDNIFRSITYLCIY